LWNINVHSLQEIHFFNCGEELQHLHDEVLCVFFMLEEDGKLIQVGFELIHMALGLLRGL
jgi:hypothetical protein